MRKFLLLTILMMLVSARLPRVSRGRPVATDSKLVDSPEDMVEQILLNCGLNPTEMQTIVRSLDLSILHGIVTDSANTKLNRKFVNEVMHKKGERTLPNCQSKRIFLHVSGEDSQKNRYSEYLTSLCGRDTLSRRHLADRTNSGVLHTFDPSLAPVLVSLSCLDHNVESPSYSPPMSRSALASPSPLATFRYKFLQESESTMEYELLPPEEHKNSESSLVVTVVLTAAGTSVITILLFFLCKRCLGNKYDRDGLKDESPLLTLNTRDFSGSSQESNEPVGAIQKDKIGHIAKLDGSGEAPASGAPSGNLASSTNASINDISLMPPPLLPLKPPPGRKVAFTPSLPPLAPPPPITKPKPGPPPPPKAAPPPPKAAPPPPKVAPPRPSRIRRPSLLGPDLSDDTSTDAHAPKTKLKPFFWDKVSTNPENSMVWNEIKDGSFQFNEERIETLFGYCYDDKGKNEHKKASSSKDPSQYIILLEPKKSQNLAISLKAMGVKVDEVSDALMEGNSLPVELLQTLLRMAPNNDEELRIRLYTGDPSLLGPGEQFLKAILEIHCAFKRIDALLFMTSLEEDVSSIKESFACLEVGSKELRSSRLFLKLLEAVLKLGNRMNDGTFRGCAQAFKLDTLLKLSDVKGTDGKTTLLHFVVQEIIRSEGIRAVRLAKENKSNSNLTTSSMASDDQIDDPLEESEDHYRNLGLKVVSVLSTELENVKKAANTDTEAVSVAVASLGRNLVKTKEFLNTDMKNLEEESGFYQSLKSFIEHAEADINLLQKEEDRVKSLVKSTADYFHGNSGRDEGLRLFVIVRDFLGMLDKACKEVRESQKKIVKTTRSKDNQTLRPIPEPEQRLFPAIRDRRVDSSSSDDEES